MVLKHLIWRNFLVDTPATKCYTIPLKYSILILVHCFWHRNEVSENPETTELSISAQPAVVFKTDGSASFGPRSQCATLGVCLQKKYNFHIYVALRSLNQFEPNFYRGDCWVHGPT